MPRPVNTFSVLLRRSATLLLPLLLVGGLAAGPAAAETKTITVPGTIQVLNGANPAKPGNCSALVFAQWTATAYPVLSATATVNFPSGRVESESAAGPLFGDTTAWVKTYTVGAGAHWIMVGKGWKDGPSPDDCSTLATDIRAAWAGAVATIALTFEVDPKLCEAAKAKQKDRSKAVARLKTKLKNAPSSKKPGIKKALESARAKLLLARTQVTGSC